MNDSLSSVFTFVIGTIQSFDLFGVALLVLAPELLLPFAGFLVARGQLGFGGVLIAATLGAMLSQWAFYAVARRVGQQRVLAFVRRYGRFVFLSEQDVRRSLELFVRLGDPLGLFGRAVPTVRSLISIPAGLKKCRCCVLHCLPRSGTRSCSTPVRFLAATGGRSSARSKPMKRSSWRFWRSA